MKAWAITTELGEIWTEDDGKMAVFLNKKSALAQKKISTFAGKAILKQITIKSCPPVIKKK